jgi:isocitrate/isopropylmalate dehydrogenase
MRQELNLYANLRPVKSYPGTKSLFNNLDFVIVRENTEGMYSGIEEETEEGATAKRIITRKASERISKFGFEYAVKTERKTVTAVHKANVLKKTDGVFKESFYKIAQKYPQMKTNDFYVDATAMYFLTKPEMFDVIITTNLFGDILSDEGAGLVGGLGLIPSANIGDKLGLFEPVHGSAPLLAGKGVANPSAMILSAALMLNYLDEVEEAKKIEKAVVKTLAEGKIVTRDMGGNASTMKMAKEVKKNLENL